MTAEEVNRALWDERAPAHASSPDYGFDRFRDDPQHLSDTVRFAGLQLTGLEEHETVPWEALPGHMVRGAGEWRLREQPERLPLTYTLQAVKPR